MVALMTSLQLSQVGFEPCPLMLQSQTLMTKLTPLRPLAEGNVICSLQKGKYVENKISGITQEVN